MNQLSDAQPLKHHVLAHLSASLGEGRCSARDVAKHFRVSERTLRRHLSAEGSSYGELLDETRHELATSWLAGGERPIAEIASTLGFSHVSSFYKAFRRWTGLTPVEYRRQAAEGEVRLVTQLPPGLVAQAEAPPASAVRNESVDPAAPRASGASS